MNEFCMQKPKRYYQIIVVLDIDFNAIVKHVYALQIKSYQILRFKLKLKNFKLNFNSIALNLKLVEKC